MSLDFEQGIDMIRFAPGKEPSMEGGEGHQGAVGGPGEGGKA